MEEYVTNISLKYCGDWDIWEAIRELSQNTLDELDELPSFEYSTEGLTVRDNGEGITLKQLCLLGISEKKSTEARGKYGEGLKIALTIFVRKGYTVRVKSKNFICLVDKTIKFNEQVLRYRYEENGENIEGTEITILGYRDKVNFADRFNVNGNKEVLFQYGNDMMIKEDTPKLYVKNIFVKDLTEDKALFSYDLSDVPLERDRNIPNTYYVKWYIGGLIEEIEDRELIGTLLEAFRQDTLESHVTRFKPNEIWKDVFTQKYGRNATITADETLSGKARYHGFKTIVIRNETIREGLNSITILDTNDAIVLKQKSRTEKTITDLDRTEKDNLQKAIAIIKNATRLSIPNMKIFETKNGDVLGYANKEGIGIKRTLLKDLGELLTCLLEETIHFDYKIDDVTPEFQQRFAKHMSEVLSYVTKEREGTEFNARLLKTNLTVKGYGYVQYSVKIPMKLNGQLVGKQYVTIKLIGD